MSHYSTSRPFCSPLFSSHWASTAVWLRAQGPCRQTEGRAGGYTMARTGELQHAQAPGPHRSIQVPYHSFVQEDGAVQHVTTPAPPPGSIGPSLPFLCKCPDQLPLWCHLLSQQQTPPHCSKWKEGTSKSSSTVHSGGRGVCGMEPNHVFRGGAQTAQLGWLLDVTVLLYRHF